MPDNNPIIWPPPPKTENRESLPPPPETKQGRASLILAISMLLVFFFDLWAKFSGLVTQGVTDFLLVSMPVQILGTVLGGILGIQSWQTICGRIGGSMSVVIMLAQMMSLFVSP